MAGEPSDARPAQDQGLPAGFIMFVYSGRDAIQCRSCGMAWLADRMEHWANHVYLEEHARGHVRTRRKPVGQLPAKTRRMLNNLDAG